MSTELSNEANQLYQFMTQQRSLIWEPREGRHPILFVYEANEDFLKTNANFLVELKKVKWITGHERRNWIVLGYGIVEAHLFGDQLEIIELIRLLLLRYTTAEQQQLEALFASFDALRKRGTTQPSVKRNELEYFARYPVNIVMKSVITYLNLKPEQQHGANYLRGIIRNENQRVAIEQGTPLLAPLHKSASEKSSHKPTVDYSILRERSTWVEKNIDQAHSATLTPEQLTEYIRSLEEQFDEQRATSSN